MTQIGELPHHSTALPPGSLVSSLTEFARWRPSKVLGPEGEESPDIDEQGAWRKPGRGDPTESATETNRLSFGAGKGEMVG